SRPTARQPSNARPGGAAMIRSPTWQDTSPNQPLCTVAGLRTLICDQRAAFHQSSEPCAEGRQDVLFNNAVSQQIVHLPGNDFHLFLTTDDVEVVIEDQQAVVG